jgi:hypothetical protein
MCPPGLREGDGLAGVPAYIGQVVAGHVLGVLVDEAWIGGERRQVRLGESVQQLPLGPGRVI